MLARLHRETAADHGDGDAHRRALLDGAVDAARYRAFLAHVYGFEAPVEAALAITAGVDLALDLRARGQVRLLRADLLAMGVVNTSTLPRCTAVAIGDVAQALGWAYMLERDNQLHGLVERHLRSRLPGVMRVAGSYLAVQERSAASRLRELGEAIDRVALRPAIAGRIVAAAKAAFRCQRSWYQLAMPVMPPIHPRHAA